MNTEQEDFVLTGIEPGDFGSLNVTVSHLDGDKIFKLHDFLESEGVEHVFQSKDGEKEKIFFKRVIMPKLNYYIHEAFKNKKKLEVLLDE